VGSLAPAFGCDPDDAVAAVTASHLAHLASANLGETSP
jgi:hypothetical protein